MRRTLVLLLALLATGCIAAPGGTSEAEHHLRGTFTREATQDEVGEAVELAKQHGGEMAILESFPLQLSVTGLGKEDCEKLRAALAAKSYIAEVGECRPVQASSNPDDAVSSP